MQDRCTLKRENGETIIELKVTDPDEFYNPFDPSPAAQKDLRSETAGYILESLTGKEKKVRFVIYLEEKLYRNSELSSGIERAVSAYFRSKQSAAKHRHLIEKQKGRRYLIRGLLFLIVCVVLSSLITTFSENSIVYAVGQSLVVIGWVALWKPAEFYLYENRDLKNDISLMKMLSDACIEIREMA